MKFVGEKDYQHGMDTKVGVLITNLGTVLENHLTRRKYC